jgi:hypothetical protein
MGIEGTILTMFDRIAHESTTELDRQQTLEGLRRKLHGELPSSILKAVTSDAQMVSIYQDEISQLRAQLVEAETKNAQLEQSIGALNAQLTPQPVNGHYTLEQFLAALQRRLGRTYGWRKDYVFATKQTPGAVQVETTHIQQWQAKGLVPQVYVEQIDKLKFPKRTSKGGIEWSPDNYDYLATTYLANPTLSNRKLAEQCSTHFGREITENSIRGALDRLRNLGRIPKRRPSRSPADDHPAD